MAEEANRQVPQARVPDALFVQGSVVLLYALRHHFAAPAQPPSPAPGLGEIAIADAESHLVLLAEVEQRILGEAFHAAERTRRAPLGELVVEVADGTEVNAQVYLVTHRAGVALFEVWLEAPLAPFDVQVWIDRLRFEREESLAARAWRALGPVAGELGASVDAPELYLPVSVLRAPNDDLDTIIENYGKDLVRLLNLDGSTTEFKRSYVAQQLGQDFCLREGGLSLLSRRSALDLHARGDDAGRASLPLLVTLELLGLERSVLRLFLAQLTGEPARPLDELVQLKQDVLDGLEEYYGTLATGNTFSAQATAAGKSLLGLDDLHNSVLSRLDMVSFAVTTRLQKRMNLIGFWIAVLFGAIETGLVAGTIASSHRVAWTVGVALISVLLISVILLRFSRA